MYNFLKPPVFPDDEKTQTARALHAVVCILFIAATLFLVVSLAFLSIQPLGRTILIVVSFYSVVLVSFMLNKRGYTRIASLLLLSLLWVVGALIALTGGGLHSPANSSFLIFIFIAGLLLGTRAGVISAAISCATILSFAVLESRGLLPVPLILYTPYSYWAIFTVLIVIIIGIQNLANMTIKDAVRANKKELAERKIAEQMTRKSEALYRSLVSTSPDTIVQTDMRGNILLVSDNALGMVGLDTLEKAIGSNILEWVVPEHRDRVLKRLGDISLGLKFPQNEYQCIREDGTTFWAEIHSSCLKDDKGILTGIIAIVRNVSGRILAEESKRVLEEQLFQAQRMESIGTLASGIAHDFNNILTIISGNADLLLAQPLNQEKAPKRLDAIARAADRGVQLIKQLLTFARKTEVRLQTLLINDLVEEVANLLSETFTKTIEIEVELAPGLPEMIGDPNQLHQVLMNLSVNARDAILGGGKITISTQVADKSAVNKLFPLATAASYVIMKVSDTGMGMDEETRKRMFYPFFTTKEPGKGTGLGLAVVTGIVANHRGFIDVTSVLGSGTEFAIYLPAEDQVTGNCEEVQRQLQQAPGGKETILIVEDETFLRDLLKESLEQKGYQVYAATDGEEAMAIFDRHSADIALVLSDFGLPKFDGNAVLRHVRSQSETIPILIMSGFIEPEKRKMLQDMGVQHIIMKPYHIGEVLQMLRDVLDR